MTVTVNEIEYRFRNKGRRISQERNVAGPVAYPTGGFDVTFADLEVVEEVIPNCDGGYTCEIAAIVGNVVTVIARIPMPEHTPVVHPDADVMATLDDHAVHAHDLQSTGTGAPPTDAMGLDAGPALVDAGVAGPHIVPGGVAGNGVQDIAAPQAHGVSGVDLAHAAVPRAVGDEVPNLDDLSPTGADLTFRLAAKGN